MLLPLANSSYQGHGNFLLYSCYKECLGQGTCFCCHHLWQPLKIAHSIQKAKTQLVELNDLILEDVSKEHKNLQNKVSSYPRLHQNIIKQLRFSFSLIYILFLIDTIQFET